MTSATWEQTLQGTDCGKSLEAKKAPARRQIETGHYATFEHRLKGWKAFEDATTSAEPHWFKDLLFLWRPSGYSSGELGLRLAIRNGYLNFYRLGQSVARVACVRKELVAYVHYKYVLGDLPGYSGPLYLRLNANGVFSPEALGAAYEGSTTLNQWVGKAGAYAGVEKKIVDQLVEKNDHVVDLEMAIPAWALRKTAVRMDLVAIEDGTVVFWEVKTILNSEICCEAAFEEDRFPHVLKQLSNYRVFLEENSHIELVESAYRNTAKILVDLRALADKYEIGPTLELGQSIKDASKAQRLDVARLAALVVVGLPAGDKRAKQAWASWKATHEGKLLGKIPMRVLESPEALVFAGAQ
jgi:hypothetical protein